MSGTIGAVIGALPAIRPDETDRPKRPALASHLYHEQSCSQSSARPMSDLNIVNHTDVNDDIDTDLRRSSSDDELTDDPRTVMF